MQLEYRNQRQRDLADVRAELADGLRGPELQEIGMPPETATRPQSRECDHQLAGVGAGARAIVTSPLTVFARTSSSGPSSSSAGASAGASVSSSSELVDPL